MEADSKPKRKPHWGKRIALALVLLWAWARWGPMDPLFPGGTGTVVTDRHGRLLNATVADDGQWRLPASSTLPERYTAACLSFEDRRFRWHPGVDPVAIVRAVVQNLRSGRTVSGGSTLTMQVARMARGNRQRSAWAKLDEVLLAIRLEVRCSKDSILALHAAHAPFGGNVVGLEAAAWRWYGSAPEHLGWAQCATLAVLPNAPSSIHPGKSRDALRAKRDRLLLRLYEQGAIDSLEWSLAVEEPLPAKPLPLPALAPQLLTSLRAQGLAGQRIATTVDAGLQQRITASVERHGARLRGNGVHNVAVLVIDIPTGQVLAYVGNVPGIAAEHAPHVDIIQARRSTGSLLKPFLYAAMLQHGERLPRMLVSDVPTRYDGFMPRNFDERYMGAVPADEALARSLNVPAVRALHEHGIVRALKVLHGIGLHSIDRPAEHYGLSLMVGGAESSLWELAGAYASMERVRDRYGLGGHAFHQGSIHPPIVLLRDTLPGTLEPATTQPPFDAAAAHFTLEALTAAVRPEDEQGWHSFRGGQRIAWKTGTSYGHRDAWSIGTTTRHCVAVWAGNASGEGRPGLTGATAAAPLLFEVFAALPRADPAPVPHDALLPLPICRQSGHRAGRDCPDVDTLAMPAAGARTAPCPYHRLVHVDPNTGLRTTDGNGNPTAWFVLPPGMERFYRERVATYRPLPPGPAEIENVMEVLYPASGARLLIPRGFDGLPGNAIVEAAHRDPRTTLHWHLDGDYLGSTRGDHRMAVPPIPGRHRLTLTDADGRMLHHGFTLTTATSADAP